MEYTVPASVRDLGARARIRTFLAEQGPIVDASGGATVMLKEAIGYKGSMVAFIQLITAMDKGGEITREIKGKRTYGIALKAADAHQVRPPVSQATAVAAPVPFQLDYDQLARAILREAVRMFSDKTTAESDEVEALRAERDEYVIQLQLARQQLDALLGLTRPGSMGADATTRSLVEQLVGRTEQPKRAAG
jgi:hypothetical protein